MSGETKNKIFQGGLQWNDYSSYIRRVFGERVQKISIDAGFTCPNRDGTISTDACIYCNNDSFSPFYCSNSLSIKEQIDTGIEFFAKKYKTQRYLAYFQTYTNTYKNIDELKRIYSQALENPLIVGIVIATRPDCINTEILEMLLEIVGNKYLLIEYGAESTKNSTLEFINRGHSWEQTVEAVLLTNKYKIDCGLHLILGLPGENENDFFDHAKKLSELPIKTLKLHQLQILKNTKIFDYFMSNRELFFDLSFEKYKQVIIRFLEELNPEIIIDRLTSESPKEILVYPNWSGRKNYEIVHEINNDMKKANTYQGKKYLKSQITD